MFDRLGGWCHRHMPTRETFENIGWLRPIAHRILLPELWRFHRRSVPRGVALGMLVGVLIPVAQTVLAALLALPARANVPVASVTTLITNPLTTPPIWLGAYWIGRMILGTGSGAPALPDGATAPETDGWLHWFMTQAGPATLLGLVIIAIVSAILGYFLAAVGWRWWIGRKWARRQRERRERG